MSSVCRVSLVPRVRARQASLHALAPDTFAPHHRPRKSIRFWWSGRVLKAFPLPHEASQVSVTVAVARVGCAPLPPDAP